MLGFEALGRFALGEVAAQTAVTATALLVEDDDTVVAYVGFVGDAILAEQDDELVATGVPVITGDAALLEDADQIIGVGTSVILADMVLVEADDVIISLGSPVKQAWVLVVEDDDTVAGLIIARPRQKPVLITTRRPMADIVTRAELPREILNNRRVETVLQ